MLPFLAWLCGLRDATDYTSPHTAAHTLDMAKVIGPAFLRYPLDRGAPLETEVMQQVFRDLIRNSPYILQDTMSSCRSRLQVCVCACAG